MVSKAEPASPGGRAQAPKPSPITVTAIKSQADAEKVLEQLATQDRLLRAAENNCNTEITRVRELHAPSIEQARMNCAVLHDALEIWSRDCARAGKVFEDDKRSLDLLHGTLSFRQGQRKLELLARWTWEKVTASIKFSPLKGYLRIKEDIDSAKILRDTKGDDPVLDPKKLSALGLKITQEERFHVELKEL